MFRSYCRCCRHLSSSYLAGGRSLFPGHDSLVSADSKISPPLYWLYVASSQAMVAFFADGDGQSSDHSPLAGHLPWVIIM